MINASDTILTQYADSPKLKSIIYSFNQAVGIVDFIDDFYEMVWNIETAGTYGLDVWGKIVVVSRQLTVSENQIYFASTRPALIRLSLMTHSHLIRLRSILGKSLNLP